MKTINIKWYYVYILTNKTNSTLYIGVTNDVERRIYEHKNNLIEGFTSKYNLHKLVYLEDYRNIKEALIREKQLKGWNRTKKEQLINSLNPSWMDLSEDWFTE